MQLQAPHAIAVAVLLAACSNAAETHGVGGSGGTSAAPAGNMALAGAGTAGTVAGAIAMSGRSGGGAGAGGATAAAGAGASGAGGSGAAGTHSDDGGATAGSEATAGASGSAGGPTGPSPCEPVPAGMQLAFPGAEGFGRFARGGRGGAVCHVTQLGDSGAGSLRDCVSKGDRTVVFDVGGWITLTGNLGITANNLTIAGQTAPGGGIGVRGTKLSIGGQHIVVRFLRVRRGIVTTTDRNDAMAVSSSASDVILDHCSIGFGTDENLSMPGDEGVGPRNLTVQWTVIAWGLQRNNHSAGSLLTADGTTIHHSVYAFNGTRNPKARSEEGRVLDFVNNVIYGWNAPDPVGEAQGWDISQQAFLLADTSNGKHNANAVGNYFIAHGTRTASKAFGSGATDAQGAPTFQLYFDGNLLDGNANGMLDASSDDWGMVGTATQLDTRLDAPLVCTQDARAAYDRVLMHAGASLPMRDEVDAKLMAQIRAQNGIKIQNEADLAVGADGYGTLAAGTAPADGDGDGMPDAWESAHGLDPSDGEDGAKDPDGDGYTALEDYLNELAAPAFPQ